MRRAQVSRLEASRRASPQRLWAISTSVWWIAGRAAPRVAAGARLLEDQDGAMDVVQQALGDAPEQM
jgi:hypothetical protein